MTGFPFDRFADIQDDQIRILADCLVKLFHIYFIQRAYREFILFPATETVFYDTGHSYGGMVITGVADRLPDQIRRLVYWNAFVPNNGEALDDMIPPEYIELFDRLVADDGSMMLPFEVWREAFINDASLELAQETYGLLNPHPRRTFAEPIKLDHNPAEIPVPKSYVNCTEDTSLPHHVPWHPRLSKKLGLFRLVQTPGSHELCFTDPGLLALKLMEAGRD